MTTFEKIADLTFEIERYRLEPRTSEVRSHFTRRTTLVWLEGQGQAGVGEDVCYESMTHRQLETWSEPWPLAGRYTLASFSDHLDTLGLFPVPPPHKTDRDFRRWALESAALDLALRQHETTLARQLGRELAPVHFVLSMGLGTPPSLAPLERILEHYPEAEFKLDTDPSWSDGLVQELAALKRVRVLDFKGAYSGTPVDQPPDEDLYRRVLAAFPEAWIEDPHNTETILSIVEPHQHRITWDAVLHRPLDLETLPWPPNTINMKPSRFGRCRDLFDTYDACAQRGIQCYGGGQFEIGPGRRQVQILASLFHPEAANDVAPSAFNHRPVPEGLPQSPLTLDWALAGFR